MKHWGEFDDVWNDLFSILPGWALYVIPEIGPVLVVGPLAGWIAGALPNAPIFGELSAIGMGLHSLGISRDSIRCSEGALKEGRYLLLLNGPAEDVRRAKEIIGARTFGAA